MCSDVKPATTKGRKLNSYNEAIMKSTNMHMWKAIDKRYSADSDEQSRHDLTVTTPLFLSI